MHAEGIHVVARIRAAAVLDQLRARVCRRHAGDRVGARACATHEGLDRVRDDARDAEVDHLDDTGGREHHVARRQIAVHDALGVCELERVGNAADDRQGFQRIDAGEAGRTHLAGERGAGKKLHRHEDRLAVAIAVEHAHDVRVHEIVQVAHLPMQQRHRVVDVFERNVEDFDGDVRIVASGLDLAQVDRLVDARHAALARQLHQAEATDERSDVGRLRRDSPRHCSGVGKNLGDVAGLRITGPVCRRIAKNEGQRGVARAQ